MLRSKIRRVTVALALFLPQSITALGEDSFFCLLDAEMLGGYSKVVEGKGIASTQDNWSVSPNFKLNDSFYWINLYRGDYSRSSQVVTQEEGGRQTQSTQSHSLSTALKWDVTKTWSLRPLFFVDWSFINETEDESFGEGLYDYRDVGGALESTWKTLETKTAQDAWRIGFRYFDRHYPNYQSLFSQVLPGGQSAEINEKDFEGYKITTSFDAGRENGWSWGLDKIILFKDFTDKKTINSNGIREGDNRQDWLGYLNAYAHHALTKELRFRLDAQLSSNSSNLDFYDTRNTTTLTDDSFIEDYFDYYSAVVKPSLTYSKALAKQMMLSVTGSYAFSVQHYPDRKIQNAAGIYQTDNQEDLSHTFSLRVSVPVTKNLSWVSVGNYTMTDSNQKFEQFYLYTYDRWNVLSGISFKY